MAKYMVEVAYSDVREIEVEADSIDDACEKGRDKWREEESWDSGEVPLEIRVKGGEWESF